MFSVESAVDDAALLQTWQVNNKFFWCIFQVDFVFCYQSLLSVHSHSQSLQLQLPILIMVSQAFK